VAAFDKEKIDQFWKKLKPIEQTRISAKAKWEQMTWLSVLIEWPNLIPERLKEEWNTLHGE
jgi:hypothetical protein